MLNGEGVDLSHLRLIGAWALFHIMDANKLGHTSWEKMVCRLSQNKIS